MTPSQLPATGAIRGWLRAEGFAVFTLAAVLHAAGGYSWLLFVLLFLLPDVAITAYLAGPRAGALAYNAVHSYVGPAMLGIGLLATGQAVAVPLVWAAHIGFDRAMGYGLKYDSGFTATHLGRIGSRRGRQTDVDAPDHST
jgi:hypothetical protein